MIKKGPILLCILSFVLVEIHAQNEGHEHHHLHHKNEIGIANAPVYFVKEKEVSYGLHVHYIHTIAESPFGLGLGFERIFDEHKHNTLGIVANYRATHELSFNISPGITFEGENTSEINFALHLESTYEYEFDHFHIGPVMEFAYDPEDIHLSLGLHIGYGF